MSNFTMEERTLIWLYSDGTRTGTIQELLKMRFYLEDDEDEVELLNMTNSAIDGLQHMTDAEFENMDFEQIEDFSSKSRLI